MEPRTISCVACKNSFVIDADDLSFYKKMKVPPPTHCPLCRLKRRFSWRNERCLYRRRDDASGKDMFAGFAPEVPFPVYDRDYWWSDQFDDSQYGRDYDFSRPFFEQLRELMNSVPWPSRSVIRSVNSDYIDQAGDAKNCYLCFNCDFCEDCMYLIRGVHVRSSLDVLQISNSELAYESVLIEKCFRAFFSLDCESSTDIWFSRDCVGCTNCFGCVGLRKKSYCIWNTQYSKEEYAAKLQEFNLGSRASIAALRAQAMKFWSQFPVRYYHGVRNVNSSGDMINDTKNTRQSWWVSDAEDIRYGFGLYMKVSDSYDYTVWGNSASRMYECVTSGEEASDLKFCFECWPGCKNLEYCITCHSCSDCFGCVGLKKKQYCIFNKQYSKEEYFALRARIVEQMNAMPYISKNAATGTEIPYRYGEFFPSEFSPFAYNESMLFNAFPRGKEQAIAEGYRWRDPDFKEFKITLTASDMPDAIADTADDIVKQIIQCGTCKKAYRIVPAEFAFHQQIGVALPDTCPDCRHDRRFTLLNPPSFREGACMCAGTGAEKSAYKNNTQHFHGADPCPNSFETAYPLDTENAVYCEQCYNAEIV